MTKNTKGGSGHKKQRKTIIGGKSKPKLISELAKSENPAAFEVYGRVINALGNRRMNVFCQLPDKPLECTTITCRIRGSLRTRISTDDYVLVQLYDFNLKQGQIINVFTQDDVNTLTREGLWDMPRSKPASAIKMPNDSDIDDSDSEDQSQEDQKTKGADSDDDVQMEKPEKNIDVI